MEDVNQLLKKGIQALKAGQREEARALLMQVIEVDEESERAWLWLSGTVDSDEERRICLENVLTLNPENKVAQKGLAKLNAAPIEEAILPPSLEARAAQAVKSESQDKSGWWSEPIVEELPGKTAVKKFDDVWSGHEELCAFCAAPITDIPDRCPQCERKLIGKALVNAVPGKYFGRLQTWLIVFLSLRLLSIVIVLIYANRLAPGIDLISLLVEAAGSFVPMVVAAIGIFRRETWAYWLLLLASVVEVGFFVYEVANSGDLFFLVCMSPFLGLALFILYTIYMAGEDFQKRPVRRVAVVSDRVRDPADLDKVAQRLAKEEKWAAAVLYWQRAVGRASGHAPYLLRLGRAYGKLGFYERSLDTLKSALEAARNSDVRQEIEKELVYVTRLSRGVETQPQGEGA
jgi:tetratricopeptide (TPR) repeat protein